MIITVEKAKELVKLDGWTDAKIEMKLKAIEHTIRSYTNNNFQDRDYRRIADVVGDFFCVEALNPFKEGDTIEVTETSLNKGLFTITSAEKSIFTVKEAVIDEKDVLVTKVHYPENVVECALNLLEWEVKNRSKVGIQSETLSRHSVTYFNMEGDNADMGYPKSLLGFLKPYRKVRC